VLAGNAINLGGRLYVDHAAQIHGDVITKKGETTIQPRPGDATFRDLDRRRDRGRD
jgi:hypothetical protein